MSEVSPSENNQISNVGSALLDESSSVNKTKGSATMEVSEEVKQDTDENTNTMNQLNKSTGKQQSSQPSKKKRKISPAAVEGSGGTGTNVVSPLEAYAGRNKRSHSDDEWLKVKPPVNSFCAPRIDNGNIMSPGVLSSSSEDTVMLWCEVTESEGSLADEERSIASSVLRLTRGYTDFFHVFDKLNIMTILFSKQ